MSQVPHRRQTVPSTVTDASGHSTYRFSIAEPATPRATHSGVKPVPSLQQSSLQLRHATEHTRTSRATTCSLGAPKLPTSGRRSWADLKLVARAKFQRSRRSH